MGAFDEIFGFDGRIGRLGYVWRTLAAALVIGLLAGSSVKALGFLLQPTGLGGEAAALAGKVIVGVALLALWSGLGLTSRRLRDMGLEPIYIVPLYAALWVVNGALLTPLSRVDPSRYGLAEQAWTAVQWLAPIPLLLWPGRPARDALAAGAAAVRHTQRLNWRESD